MRLLAPKSLQALLLLVLCPAMALGQRGFIDRTTNVDVLVRVMYSNERPAGSQIHVQIISETGVPAGDNFTNSEGRVSFHITSPGNFEVRVSGPALQGTATEQIRIEDLDKSRVLMVYVTPKTESVASKPNTAPVTSAADLRVPAEAKKAFHKGMLAWEQKDYATAATHFEKAVALYPEYDTAYNNLAVMYMHLNEPEKARAAFEKSVTLNDHNADADRNLARILLQEGNFARAEDLLKKSLVVEPLNPVTLTLLCAAEAQSGQGDAALATAHRTHQLPHEGYSVVHFIAGQVLEKKGQSQDAFTEYQTYLQESPNGPEAAEVRHSVARLTAANQPPAQ